MQLKSYQSEVITSLKTFSDRLLTWRDRCLQHPEFNLDPIERAWNETRNVAYKPRKNALGVGVPNVCVKVPTGGGKTLIAIHAIGNLTNAFRSAARGLVVWVVPTAQIYQQTLERLRDRSHPYRQQLNLLAVDSVQILTKADFFTANDVAQNLVILLLMLPSANRANGEMLRFNRDSSFFRDFIPGDENLAAHAEMLTKVPNLDCYADSTLGYKQIKSSLSNAIRLCSPIIVIDEGQKAYTTLAQQTIYNLNPQMILELSATPSAQSNVLIEILGQQLLDEQMIKLDLHLINDTTQEWKDTLRSSVDLRNRLEESAQSYHARGGTYIRPINLVQVERTGNNQRGQGFIHAEDVREFLIGSLSIPPDNIAVKSSDLNELAKYDADEGLTSENCPIRYIITKQALQEGWDCSFAYVLTILANPSSKTALTQLVGRILRQPAATKTGVHLLDESYVFTYRRNGVKLLIEISDGFKAEGLGDLVKSVLPQWSSNVLNVKVPIKPVLQAEAKVRLPIFLKRISEARWKPLSFVEDLEPLLDWHKLDLTKLTSMALGSKTPSLTEHLVGLDSAELATESLIPSIDISIDEHILEMSYALADVVSNPWQAYEIVLEVLNSIVGKNPLGIVLSNIRFIQDEIVKLVLSFRDSQTEKAFNRLLDLGEIVFDLLEEESFGFPEFLEVPNGSGRLTRSDNSPIQRTLHEYYLKETFNSLEMPVVLFLDQQERILYWYRNRVRKDYRIQGWKKNKVYPDFLFYVQSLNDSTRPFMCVLETKGLQLAGNADSEYKLSLMKVCEDRWSAKIASITDFTKYANLRNLKFKFLDSEEWERELSQLLTE